MKFTGHYIITVLITLLITIIFDYRIGIMIGLAHFIPSIDWIMKRLDVLYRHHRSLLHNLFIIPLSYILFFLFTKEAILPIFCALSTALHILIDYISIKGKGMALFFPLSKKRYKLPLLSEDMENTIVNLAIVITAVICVILVLK